MTIIAITMILMFLLGMLAFGCSKILCVLGIIVSLVVLILKLDILPLGKLSDKVQLILKTSSTILIFVIGAFTSISSVDGGVIAFEKMVDETMVLILEDKEDEAWDSIERIEDTYGFSDNTDKLDALTYMISHKYSNALSAVARLNSDSSIDYYLLLEAVYIGEGVEENVDELRNLYVDAAIDHPDWTYAQKMAGIALIDNSDFEEAEYHLLRAYEQEPFAYDTAYYLGVTCYEQGNMADALVFFQESLDREPDENIMGYIAWYANELGSGGVKDE